MMQRENIAQEELMPHNLSLEGRAKLKLSGVCDVKRFDEHSILLETGGGGLMIHGSGLQIDRLSLETGELGVEGRIDRLIYADDSSSDSFWSRLFR